MFSLGRGNGEAGIAVGKAEGQAFDRHQFAVTHCAGGTEVGLGYRGCVLVLGISLLFLC